MNRRDFLATMAASALAAGCGQRAAALPPLPPGNLLGADFSLGHRLREGGIPAPTEVRRIPVLIIGGGVSGLSAGWRLLKAGFEDFAVLELEAEPGGNARYGQNAVSAYPWGAHYLPLPGKEARAVRALLSDLGVLLGDPSADKPRYDERYLSFVPQERIYRDGLWQDGIVPQTSATARDRDQLRRFQELMAGFKRRRSTLGARAFAIPMAYSASEAELLALDLVSFRDYLLSQGLDSPLVHWYADYACRDDYGAHSSQVSAWAGIHYFACRDGETDHAAADVVLTAPEGNGWLVRGMAGLLGKRVVTGALAWRVEEGARGVTADVYLAQEKRSVRYQAEHAVWAGPTYPLPHVLSGAASQQVAAARTFQHAPWMVANLTLREPPAQGAGASLAWDNVMYDSPSLGYVVATHQRLRFHPGPTVFTFYHALCDFSPADGRNYLLSASREQWAEWILGELSRAHRDIRQLVTQLDVFRWGHAMVRPVPGFLFGPARRLLAEHRGRLRFAHADTSGLSLFEEAQYRGVKAAEDILSSLSVSFNRLV